ncbi:MAG: HAD family hydrolase [bacterium]
MRQYDVIAFDADDTLWHNEPLYTLTQGKFVDLLAGYHETEWIEQRLYETEIRNLELFGYGVKGFTLSMIETAIELTEGRIQGREIEQIISYCKGMLCAPVELLEHVKETVPALAASHRLMIITKGDLFDQEAKIARSGLAEYFDIIEIVSEKSAETYRAILAKYELNARTFLMVGNSLKSDILPVREIGAHALYVPYGTTWVHEQLSPAEIHEEYFELEHIGLLPEFLVEGGLT